MSDPSTYNQPASAQQNYPPNQQGSPMQGQRPQNPLANYQFSSEEMRVLRECNTESFFQRCIPFSATFGLASHFAVKNGLLSPNPKFGSIPKVVVSVIIGYFLGKVSYQQKCAEKIMQLPDSKLAQILRQKKQGGIAGGLAPSQSMGTPGFGLTPFSSTPTRTEDVYDDTSSPALNTKSSALDLDTERPTFGLDDSQVFSDNQSDMLPLEPPKHQVTYEELRKKNRDEYYKRMQSNIPNLQDAPAVIRVKENIAPSNTTEEIQVEKIRSMKKNQYGDTWSQ